MPHLSLIDPVTLDLWLYPALTLVAVLTGFIDAPPPGVDATAQAK